MQLRDVMSRTVEAVSKDNSVAEAAQIMRDREIGFLPVIDGTELLGVVTDRDIVLRAVFAGKDPQSIRLADVASENVQTVQADADIDEAFSLMQQQQVQRLLVVDSDGHYEGVVSIGDLARQTGDEKQVGATCEQIAQPS
jgi:CBS domain-containing protein